MSTLHCLNSERVPCPTEKLKLMWHRKCCCCAKSWRKHSSVKQASQVLSRQIQWSIVQISAVFALVIPIKAPWCSSTVLMSLQVHAPGVLAPCAPQMLMCLCCSDYTLLQLGVLPMPYLPKPQSGTLAIHPELWLPVPVPSNCHMQTTLSYLSMRLQQGENNSYAASCLMTAMQGTSQLSSIAIIPSSYCDRGTHCMRDNGLIQRSQRMLLHYSKRHTQNSDASSHPSSHPSSIL